MNVDRIKAEDVIRTGAWSRERSRQPHSPGYDALDGLCP
jgi:hypothetical protein